ncbi:hypothetical protein ACFT1A_03470 [Rhodococcus sp. NPDC057135]|uniref:hypothetical protein n=1 Tax=Rhodococcus sp. NPDC057135 TaxID=3346028 RepID=UPI0036261894
MSARDALVIATVVIGACVGSAVLLLLYSHGVLLSVVNIVGAVLVLGSIGLLILVLGAKGKEG